MIDFIDGLGMMHALLLVGGFCLAVAVSAIVSIILLLRR
jgi:hypothetical protein